MSVHEGGGRAALLAAAAGGMLVGGGVAAYFMSRKDSREPPKKQVPAVSEAPPVSSVADGSVPPLSDIDQEHFARVLAFLGEDEFYRFRECLFVVVGLGGVGSHAALMLARSGVRRLRLVDFDQVTLSSLNRHAVATRKDVGRPKAEVMKEHLAAIVPSCEVDARVAMFQEILADELLEGQPAFVLDCIDNTDTKVELLVACVTRGLRVVASAGAGGRLDPSCIQVANLWETKVDPFARTLRQRVKERCKANVKELKQVPMVFTTEKAATRLVYHEEEEGEREELAILPGFRVGILPVMGFIPAMFGNALAAYAVMALLGRTGADSAGDRRTEAFFRTLYGNLKNREHSTFAVSPVELKALRVSQEQLRELFEDVWCAKSVLSGTTKRLTFTRFDRSKPVTAGNLILLTHNEAKQHDRISPDEPFASEEALRERYGDRYDAMLAKIASAKEYERKKCG